MKRTLQCLLLAFLFITILSNSALADEKDAYAYSLNSNDRTYYYSVQDAMDATRKGLTIIMNKNWEISSPIDIVEGTISRIEMNGKQIKRVDGSEHSHTGEVFTMHPSSTLYLTGNLNKNTTFNYPLYPYYSWINPQRSTTSGGLVTGGYTYNGGGIYMKKNSKLYLDNVTIAGNYAGTNGGGIFVNGEDCQIYMYNGAQICDNIASRGGGVYSDADGTHFYMRDNSTIRNNSGTSSGGGVYFNYSWFSMEVESGRCSIHDNYTRYDGGGIYVASKNTHSSINSVFSGLDIYNNNAENGAGVYLDQINSHFKLCNIYNNTASKNGGGIYAAGYSSIENSTITGNKCNVKAESGNNYEGGGIFMKYQSDLTLSGKVTIKDNERMNTLPYGVLEHYKIGEEGYSSDDVFLDSSPVLFLYSHILADNLDSSSLIGIRNGISGNRCIAKDLNSFTYGHTFFLDEAENHHVEYITDDKELWQRIGKTQYSLIINGEEKERIDYKGQSNTYDATKANQIFNYWEVEGIDLSDNQKTNPIIHIESMPSRDVILTAHYYPTDKTTNNITLTVNAPVVGAQLPTTGTFTWIDDTSGKEVIRKKEVNVTWKNADSTDASGLVEDKEYYVCATIPSDTSQNLLFSDAATLNTKLVYQTSDALVASIKECSVNNKTLTLNGNNIKAVTSNFTVSGKEMEVDVGVGSNLDVFFSDLPKTIKATSALNGNTVTLEIEKPTEDMYAKFVKDGVVVKGESSYYYLNLNIKNPNGLKLSNNKVKVKINLVDKNSKLVSIEDVHLTFTEGGSAFDLERLIEATAVKGKAIDKDGKEFDCDLTVNHLSFSCDFHPRLVTAGFAMPYWQNGKFVHDNTIRRISEDKDNTFVYYVDVSAKDNDNLRSNNVKAKFVIDIAKKDGQLSKPKLKVVKLNESQADSFENKAVVDYIEEENDEVVNSVNVFDEEYTFDENVTSNDNQEINQDSIDNQEVVTNDENDAQQFDLDEETPTSNEIMPLDDNIQTIELEIENYDDLKKEYTNVYHSIDDGEARDCTSEFIVLSGSDSTIHTLKVWASDGANKSEVVSYSYSFNDGIETPSVNLDNGTYTVESTNTIYNDENGELSLNVNIENVEGTTVHYTYSKMDDTYGDWNYGETNEVTLSANKGETITYRLIAWASKGDLESEYVERIYTISNSSDYYKVTINSTSPDGSLNTKETYYYQKDSTFYLPLPQYEGYCLIDSNTSDYTNISEVGNDRYLQNVEEISGDIELNVTYKAVIRNLNIDVDNLTIGKQVPQINKIEGYLINGETIDLTNYFDLDNVVWTANGESMSSSDKVDYSGKYKASINIKDKTSASDKYIFIGTPSTNLDNLGTVNTIITTGSNYYDVLLTISFNKTIDKVSSNDLSLTLKNFNNLSYDDLSYEEALSLSKKEGSAFDIYNLPSKIGTVYDEGGDSLNIIWNDNFTTSFNPNNYDEQELVIEGYVKIPSYVKNTNGISNKVTLKIKVKAKQGYIPQEVIDNSSNKAVTCEEYMKSKDWTWSESKKACVYKVSNTSVIE